MAGRKSLSAADRSKPPGAPVHRGGGPQAAAGPSGARWPQGPAAAAQDRGLRPLARVLRTMVRPVAVLLAGAGPAWSRDPHGRLRATARRAPHPPGRARAPARSGGPGGPAPARAPASRRRPPAASRSGSPPSGPGRPAPRGRRRGPSRHALRAGHPGGHRPRRPPAAAPPPSTGRGSRPSGAARGGLPHPNRSWPPPSCPQHRCAPTLTAPSSRTARWHSAPPCPQPALPAHPHQGDRDTAALQHPEKQIHRPAPGGAHPRRRAVRTPAGSWRASGRRAAGRSRAGRPPPAPAAGRGH